MLAVRSEARSVCWFVDVRDRISHSYGTAVKSTTEGSEMNGTRQSSYSICSLIFVHVISTHFCVYSCTPHICGKVCHSFKDTFSI
jgi:hypothetical protein